MADPARLHQHDVLRRSLLFCAMAGAEFDALVALSRERRFARSTLIFSKGGPGTSMMAVLRGRIQLRIDTADGGQMALALVTAGQVFGELALLDGKPRSADALALDDTTVLEITRSGFLQLLKTNDSLLVATLALLCERVRAADRTIEELALLDLPARLARVLVRSATTHGSATPAGTRIELPLSQHELSMLVASSRESVNRQLQLWRAAGILSSEKGLHVIRRMHALHEIAELPD